MLNANHILGAVMFLVKGKFGNILYTGDFRYTKEMLKSEFLYPKSKYNKEEFEISIPINHLILDNTYCDTKYKFPTPEEAYKQIVTFIAQYPDHEVDIFSYTVGKEELFLSLAERFKTKIHICEKKYKLLKASKAINMSKFTTNSDESFIHIRPALYFSVKE